MNDDLHEVFHRAGEEAPPHQLDLAATVRRGTSLRRRRTVFRSVATLATLAVLGGMGVVGVQALAPRSPVSLQPAGGPTPTTSAPTSTTTASSAPTTSAPTTSEAPRMSPAEREALRTFVRTTVVDLLAPYGEAAPYVGRVGHTYFSGKADFTDDRGTTSLSVFVARGSDPDDPDDLRGEHPTSCADIEMADSCRTLPDGSFVVTTTASGYAETDPRHNDEYSNVATLYRPDRVKIELWSSNGTGEKGKQLREHPPLTQEQLTELVTDPVWDNTPIPE